MSGSDDPAPTGRRWKRLAGSVLAAEVALTATAALAESSTAGQNAAAGARLAFRIVIPSVVVVDTRTGTVYSNDARGTPVRGTFGAATLVPRGPVDPGPKPATRVGVQVTRGLAPGEVFAIP